MMDAYKRANEALHPPASAVERAVRRAAAGARLRKKRRPLRAVIPAGVAAVCFAAKAFGHRPERRYQWRPIAAGAAAAARGDEEAGLVGGGGGSAAFPVVLVQIPMYNEREVSSH